MDSSELIWGLLFGSIGVGYFIYGRRQSTFVPLIAGIALCILPYVLHGATAMILGGLAAASLPFVIKL